MSTPTSQSLTHIFACTSIMNPREGLYHISDPIAMDQFISIPTRADEAGVTISDNEEDAVVRIVSEGNGQYILQHPKDKQSAIGYIQDGAEIRLSIPDAKGHPFEIRFEREVDRVKLYTIKVPNVNLYVTLDLARKQIKLEPQGPNGTRGFQWKFWAALSEEEIQNLDEEAARDEADFFENEVPSPGMVRRQASDPLDADQTPEPTHSRYLAVLSGVLSRTPPLIDFSGSSGSPGRSSHTSCVESEALRTPRRPGSASSKRQSLNHGALRSSISPTTIMVSSPASVESMASSSTPGPLVSICPPGVDEHASNHVSSGIKNRVAMLKRLIRSPNCDIDIFVFGKQSSIRPVGSGVPNSAR
ncbi:hypothetical protein AG1IA_08823 [Rhizoctonia solani AG-1 IA]|uniref:Uncharacterized protein n=1 Tax=Thanatephorus cucumeris (strain AG1-IA) TaxID=983506 RepID=L8WK75_THACA|nr:hypothetical protein AG1IA_08823 [Rhizoctonia solani AG-1 IA]